MPLTHLEYLENEAITIIREGVAECTNPTLLYSIGKDSSVLLHLARKAFFPRRLPFPLLHIDTGWKFRTMIEFRNQRAIEEEAELIVHTNHEGAKQGITPFNHGSRLYTDVMKTEALRQALDCHKFDVAFGGARRDEEKSRAKERIFSFRTAGHRWDPKNQRPEFWYLFNARKKTGESFRVFPMSNWTELDVWRYIEAESIPVVPLYFAAPRPIVWRDGMMICPDDERMPLFPGEKTEIRMVRFRTLGCYPLTAATASNASCVAEIIDELKNSSVSERQGRLIDHDDSTSMEAKKQEGYF